MLTLGIETSCDETSCAVLRGRDEILSNIVSSSLFRHKPFGGVVPEIASRHALEQIDTVLNEALEQARVKLAEIELIAVTEGPGLIGSLLVGVSFAKTLSYRLEIPLVGVNHLEAHLSANFIGKAAPEKFTGLLVSGGHTLITYHEAGRVTILGETVDDAVGEAYDKIAKMLGLEYPGGPLIDKLAAQGDPRAFRFTRPKQDRRFDFSFSGVKTAVLQEVQRIKAGAPAGAPLPEKFVRDIAASFQDAAVSWLIEKTLDAADSKGTGDIVAGGGVSANSALRRRLTEEGSARGFKVWFPAGALTVDNAAMIARRGIELYENGRRDGLALTGIPNLKMA